MNVGISQSNYLPWLGYFEFISHCDKFVVLDTVQYTKNDWRNRNRITVNGRKQWLTIPVKVNNSIHFRINQVKVADSSWNIKHLKTLTMAYGSKNFFKEIQKDIEKIYLGLSNTCYLSEINLRLLHYFCELLEIDTELMIHKDETVVEKNLRIMNILSSLGSHEYIYTPRALQYLDQKSFLESGIRLQECDFGQTKNFLAKTASEITEPCSVIDSIAMYGVERIRELLRRSKRIDLYSS